MGETTSGSPSPSLKKSIGMAYVDQAFTADETELSAEQRGKRVGIKLAKMPFVPSNYYKRWGTVWWMSEFFAMARLILWNDYNKTKMSTIKTAVRIRPFLPTEMQQNYRNTRLAVSLDRREVSLKDDATNQKRSFRFDYLLGQECDQDEVFAQCGIDDMIGKTLDGYHSTIFAYGQTGSGKTFTMQGEESPL